MAARAARNRGPGYSFTRSGNVASMETRSQTSAERVARNDAAFREANEAIQEKAATWEIDGLLPVICECADTGCRAVVRMTRAEYENVRADPRWFINASGHHVNGQGWVKIVAERDNYVVVEKIGEAGEIAEQLDPRSAEA
jgi:hypothetical protein